MDELLTWGAAFRVLGGVAALLAAAWWGTRLRRRRLEAERRDGSS